MEFVAEMEEEKSAIEEKSKRRMPGMKVPCGECIIQKCVAWYWKFDLSLSLLPSIYHHIPLLYPPQTDWFVTGNGFNLRNFK
jgi:hypothetical protein